MGRLLSWWSALRNLSAYRREVSCLDRKLNKLQRDLQNSLEEIRQRELNIKLMRQKFDENMLGFEMALENARRLALRQEEALDSTREVLKTAEEITIPALVQSHDVIVNRWKAESAVSAARIAVANQGISRNLE